MSDGGAPPVSFKTNVNRMKTKRWVEAKHYNYDGDDWGDADEYDDYQDEDEPDASQPTGPGTGPPPRAAPDQSWGGDQQHVTAPPAPVERPIRERQNSFGRGDDQGWAAGASAGANPPPAGSHSPSLPPLRTAYGQQAVAAEQSRGSTPVSVRSQPQATLRAQASGSNASNEASHRPRVAPLPAPPQPPFAQKQRTSSSGSGSSNPPTASLRERSDSAGKSPTFIRPADIYKRMQEEKEKQRQSQESSRTSLDVAGADKQRDPSPAKGGDDTDSIRARRSPLGAVAERPVDAGPADLRIPPQAAAVDQERRSSGSPRLPEIAGFGDDFGTDFGSSFMSSQPPIDTSSTAAPGNLTSPQPASKAAPMAPEEGNGTTAIGDLQHAPSKGFRSAVEQAFDQPAVTGTSSASGSQVGRSNSESTSVISPIISRGPSDAHQPRPLDTGMKTSPIPPIAEEQSPAQTSADRGRTPAADEAPPGFVQGYRRDASAPSSDNSPARKPNLETTQGLLRQPQSVQLAPGPERDTESTKTGTNNRPGMQAETTPLVTSKDLATSSKPSSRAGSPTKSRVRDLAEKLESGPNSPRGSQDGSLAEPSGRPPNSRFDSTRPVLPGSWNSYTTNPQPSSENAVDQPSSKATADAPQSLATTNEEVAPVAALQPGPQHTVLGKTGTEIASGAADHTLPIHPSATKPRETNVSALDTPRETLASQHPPERQPGSAAAPASDPALMSTPARVANLSTEPSPSDQESDRLRKEIVRELSPERDAPAPIEPGIKKAPTQMSQATSIGVPSEYEQYWVQTPYDNNKPLPEVGEAKREAGDAERPIATDAQTSHKTAVRDAPIVQLQSVEPMAPARNVPIPSQKLQRKFSWEASTEDLAEDVDDQNITGPSSQFQGAFESGQADHVADSLFTPGPSRAALDKGHSVPQIPKGGDVGTEEDLNLLNITPHQPDFTGVDGPQFPAGSSISPSDVAAPKLQAFREVQSFQSAEQRLKGYAQARANLIKQEDGLEAWLLTTDTTENKAPLPPPKAGFGSHVPPPAIPESNTNSPAPIGGSVTNLGASPSSSKLASHQMQAKGKDLLHSSKVFGGKANVAAKGLFAKGRNKLRNAGGDKASRKPSASNVEHARDQPRVLFSFSSFSSMSHPPNQHQAPDISILSSTPITSPISPPSHIDTTRTLDLSSPLPRDDTSPITPVRPLFISKRHGVIPEGIPPGTPQAPSLMNASRPSISSLGNPEDVLPASSAPSSLSVRPDDSSNLSLNSGPTPIASPVLSTRDPTPLDPHDSSRSRNEGLISTAGENVGGVQEAEVTTPTALKTSFSTADHPNALALGSQLGWSPGGDKSAENRVESGSGTSVTRVNEQRRPTLGSDSAESLRGSKHEATPTQEDFPPVRSTPVETNATSAKREAPKPRNMHISQQAIIPTNRLLSSSEDRSVAPGKFEPEDFLLQTPDPDPEFSLMPLLDFDQQGKIRQPEPEPEPEPEVEAAVDPEPSEESERDADESMMGMLSPESGSKNADKQALSVAVDSRPFSFIEFEQRTPKDLELNFPLTPPKEEFSEEDHDRRYSLASVDEEDEDKIDEQDEEEEGGILSDKDLEGAPDTPLSARRPSGVIEEPNIGDHPAFRNGSERPTSYNGSSLRNETPLSMVQPNQHASTSRAGSAMSHLYSGAVQAPLSPKPPSRLSDSMLSRPSGDGTLAPPLADGRKRGKRRSLLSTFSGQSDRSKRHSLNFDHSLPIDPDPVLYTPSYQAAGFPHRKFSMDSQDKGGKGPQRSLSRQLLDRLPAISNPLGKSPDLTEPRAEKVEKGGKKRRFSGLSGFINRTVRPRQNSRGGPPPVNTFAHIRSTSQASYYDQSAQAPYQPEPAAVGKPTPLHERQQSYATQLSLGQHSQRSGSNGSLNRPNTSNSHRGPTYSPFPQQRSTSRNNTHIQAPQSNLLPSNDGSRRSTPTPDVRLRAKASTDLASRAEDVSDGSLYGATPPSQRAAKSADRDQLLKPTNERFTGNQETGNADLHGSEDRPSIVDTRDSRPRLAPPFLGDQDGLGIVQDLSGPDRARSAPLAAIGQLRKTRSTTTTTTTTTTTLSPSNGSAQTNIRQPTPRRPGNNRSSSKDSRRTSSAAEDISQAFSMAVAYPGTSPETNRYTPSPTSQSKHLGRDEDDLRRKRSGRDGSVSTRSGSRPGDGLAARSTPRREGSLLARSDSNRQDRPSTDRSPSQKGKSPARSTSSRDVAAATGMDEEPPLPGQAHLPTSPSGPKDARLAELPRIQTQQLASSRSKKRGTVATRAELPSVSEPRSLNEGASASGARSQSFKDQDGSDSASRYENSQPPSTTSRNQWLRDVSATETPSAQSPEERRAARRAAIEQSGIAESAGAEGTYKEAVRKSPDESATRASGRKGSVGPVVDGEVIPMTATAYPGQEWRPDFIAWEG